MVAQTLTNPAESRPPVSLHPAFPAIVALWFAALLGLGSMVIPVALLENIVTVTGLSAIVPGAEPPLGFTARGLIALVAATAGAVTGMLLARRVAQSHRPQPANRLMRIASGATRRPINAHEELGAEGLLANINRRRSLSMTDESEPSDFLSQAPLPGAVARPDFDASFDTGVVPAAMSGADGSDGMAAPEMQAAETPAIGTAGLSRPAEPQPLDLLDLGEDFVSADDLGAEPTPAEQHFTEFMPISKPLESVEMDETRDLRPSSVFRGEFRPDPAAAVSPPATVITQDSRRDPADLGTMGLPQLAEQLGRSIDRRRVALARAAAATLPVPASFPAAPASAEASAQIAPAATPAPTFISPDLQVAARPEEAAQAMAAYFGKPAAIGTPREMPAPAPLAEVGTPAEAAVSGAIPAVPTGFAAFLGVHDDDGDDGDDLTASFSLPLRHQPNFTAAADAEDDFADDTQAFDEAAPDTAVPDSDDDEDETFSSLLSLNNPYTPRTPTFVRVDEPEDDDMPVEASVIFPGQDKGLLRHSPLESLHPTADGPAARPFDRPGTSPAVSRTAPGQMDDALRTALTKLQRMSGAA